MSEPIGEAVFTGVDGQGFRIDRADPVILISVDLVDGWRKGPEVNEGCSVSLIDDLVHIHGLNGTVTYRLGPQAPNELAYIAERVSCEVEFPV